MKEKKSGESMSDAALAPMATASSAPVQDQGGSISVTLVDEAANTVEALSKSTGESVESLLETSITLLKILVESKGLGRRMVLTTRFLWPIKELMFPRPD